MREFLSGLFEVSLTMGAVTALLLILSPVWKRRFRPQWRCWAWLLVALRLAVLHNLYFYNELAARIRRTLDEGTFADFRARYSGNLEKRA